MIPVSTLDSNSIEINKRSRSGCPLDRLAIAIKAPCDLLGATNFAPRNQHHVAGRVAPITKCILGFAAIPFRTGD